MSLSDVQVRKKFKSKAWKFFRITDRDTKLAKCKICQSILTYRTSVTNLLKHVLKRHKDAIKRAEELSSDESDNDKNTDFTMSDNENEECVDDNSEDAKAVKLLESKTEEESICLLCQMTFPEQKSDQMIKHMTQVHNISQIKLVEGNILVQQEESKPKAARRSLCWEYFTVTDEDSRMAICNFCDRAFSFKTSVSNLVKHLRRKHHFGPTRQDNMDGDLKNVYKPRSEVWSFFNYVNDEKTICACIHCPKEFNVADGVENMKKHLMENHPEALLHHKSNGDPLFITTNKANDDNLPEESDEDNMHEEYLELEDTEKQVTFKPIKRKATFDRSSSCERKSRFSRKTSFERKLGFDRKPSYERITLKRKSEKPRYVSPIRLQNNIPESLEYFSNYIVSLLKELPEKISKKLQMNFVKEIIEAQILEETRKEENKSRDETVGNPEAAEADDAAVGERSVTIANGIIIRPLMETS